jgi:hypothetical protein
LTPSVSALHQSTVGVVSIAGKWLNRAILDTSHNYEVSATPCTESETAHAPSSGVAETLLHEPAGRESSYGDLMMVVAAGDRARFS